VKTFFTTMCTEEGITPLELIKWVRTCWGSMYDLIDHVLTNRVVSIIVQSLLHFLLILSVQAVDKFCLLADASPKVPNLQKKKYRDFTIEKGEWELLGLVHEVLRVRIWPSAML
jgi:hypothetical protein